MTATPRPLDALLARRILLALLPDDEWSRELVTELDHEFETLIEAGRVHRAGWWYARQLASPRTLHFLSLMRLRRKRDGSGSPLADAPSPFAGLGTDLR